jgi:hypothetical protein
MSWNEWEDGKVADREQKERIQESIDNRSDEDLEAEAIGALAGHERDHGEIPLQEARPANQTCRR